MNVNANDKTVQAVLTGGFYRVPRFQRPYSWDTSEVEDFWEDVAESTDDYFIGSMVIFDAGESSGLVDGQQRLTTVTMMLAALRNEFLRLGDTDAADGIQTLVERKDPKGKRRFVLHTETSIRTFKPRSRHSRGRRRRPPPRAPKNGRWRRRSP